MKLTFYIILIIFFLISQIQCKNFTVFGSISKNKSITITSSNTDYCVYIDTNEFAQDIKEIKIFVTVYGGHTTESYMYYDSNKSKLNNGKNITLNKSKYFDNSYYVVLNDIYFKEITHYFKIPKPSERYLYLSAPYYKPYWVSKFKVKIGVSSGIPEWIIITILIGVLAFVGIIIKIIYGAKIKRIKNKIHERYDEFDFNQSDAPNAAYTPMKTLNPSSL